MSLGIAKLLGAIALVVPGFPKLKEWAYAGFTFAWISANVAHYLRQHGAVAYLPLVLLLFLFISYVTRPASRQWPAKSELKSQAGPCAATSGGLCSCEKKSGVL